MCPRHRLVVTIVIWICISSMVISGFAFHKPENVTTGHPSWEEYMWSHHTICHPPTVSDARAMGSAICDVQGYLGELCEFLGDKDVYDAPMRQELYKAFESLEKMLDEVDRIYAASTQPAGS